jgi:hypothetical protein
MAELLSGYSSTPVGVAIFPRELHQPPRSWAASLYNIVHWSEQPKVRASPRASKEAQALSCTS